MSITCECKSMSDWGGLLITTGGVNTGSSPINQLNHSIIGTCKSRLEDWV